MLNKTEHFAGKAEAFLELWELTDSQAVKAKALATLALVHAVNQLNETLKIAQKGDKK